MIEVTGHIGDYLNVINDFHDVNSAQYTASNIHFKT